MSDTSLLDKAPFAADDPQARELLAVLLTVYDRGPEVRTFVLLAGMRAAEFPWTAPMAEVWPQVLRRAADQGRLRRLVGVIAEDPDSAAYGIIARLAATPAPATATANAAAPARLSYQPGDVRRLVMDSLDDDELNALCLDHFPSVYGQFAQGMSKSQKTIRLIEYCARRDRLPDLVRRVGEVNPVRHREFTDRLEIRDER
ncbi:effector-associated domain EAD1-containing protein [Streptomyces sp. ME19-01-6]|uniref:effector-associated domain EAD1-containing protein n=1 Tax=Streptomyces sp. ME19-01-6 TaxID=3028686 RepID=UPI0029AB12B5|nr:effector-associated domain EAD1-containing protein [Streptomyces sp. ME19-01-6]MDX3226299.1 effector-associated domain EAD1-containing protein [Streptomyces sp. ME19-01-6]